MDCCIARDVLNLYKSLFEGGLVSALASGIFTIVARAGSARAGILVSLTIEVDVLAVSQCGRFAYASRTALQSRTAQQSVRLTAILERMPGIVQLTCILAIVMNMPEQLRERAVSPSCRCTALPLKV